MWRDKQSKKIVYLQKVEFCLIDKNGCAIDGTQEEEEVIKYICGCEEDIRFGRIRELKRVAEWVDEE